MRPSFLLCLATFALTSLCAAGPYALFDGSFNGWEGDTKTTWRIEEGTFTAGSLDKTQPRNEFLATVKEFGDFELNLKWKLEGTEGFVNGGVQFRTKRIPNHHEVSGYQADLGAGTDGSLYDESRRNKMLAQPVKEVLEKARKPLGEWNTYRIRAEGPRIQLWLNGVHTVDFTETDPKIPRTGIIAVQIHGDAKSRVWYKDVVIEELGKAPDVGPVQQRFADPLPAPPREPFKDGKFEIRPGEVIVFTGGTNMVRLVEHGWFEASLALAAKEQKPRFRNMAWEGDTVYEQWRDQNFGSWKEQLDAVNATCVFLWFGQMEALDDSRDDAAFEKACAKLLDEFKAVTPRLVLLSPLPFLRPGESGAPDLSDKNQRIAKHAAILKALAMARGAITADLSNYSRVSPRDPFGIPANGMHFDLAGAGWCTSELMKQLLEIEQIGARPATGPGDEGARGQLFEAVSRKNEIWHDCWKTMNWAFAYSDRTEQPFGKGIGEHPPMAKELERYKPLLREADEGIHALASRSESGGRTPENAGKRRVVLPEAKSGGNRRVALPQDTEKDSSGWEKTTFKLREGFDVNLFADEEDGVVKPLTMRWDERGRLWVACSPSYPQLVPGEPRRDYIRICEDTDSDGYADKFTTFADGLTMPMGIEFADDGGVYVCESTQLALFRDTNGDGVSDSRSVVLSGFGTGDSHQMINSLRWGPDGCLWFSQGLHIFSRIETPHGIVRFDRAGLWRFNPRTWKLQGFFGNAAAGANCWGVTFDDWGQVFHCAADNNPGFYTTPGLGTWPNPPSYYNIGSLAVSPVKGMCMEFINSSHLPPELQGVLCKPVYFANQLLLYKLVEDGSGYKTEDLGPLLTSSSNAFRPLGVQTGPDGALYVCDWYNPVIGHYQASYRDPKRDKVHGRIWRISAKDHPLAKRPELEKMRPEELVDELRSPERWVRDQARRLLTFEEAKRISGEFWLPAEDAKPEFLYEVLAVQAGQGEVNTPLLHRCLAHDDARLRAFAMRVWSQIAPAKDHSNAPDDEEYMWKLLANGVNDRHPRVRLEAVIAAGYFKDPVAVELALGVLNHPRDRFIDYALANSIRATKPVWQPALEAGQMTFEGNAAHLTFLLQTDGSKDTSALVKRLLAKEDLPDTAREPLRLLLLNAGSTTDALVLLTEEQPTPAMLEAFAARAHSLPGLALPDAFKKTLGELLQSTVPEFQAAALKVVQACRAMEFKDRVKKLAVDAAFAPALPVFASLAGKDAVPDLVKLCRESARFDVQRAAVESLVSLDSAQAAEAAASLLAVENFPEPGDLLHRFLLHTDGPASLAASFAGKPPPAAAALVLLEALATAGRNEPALAAVLRKAAGLPENSSVVPDYSAEFVAKLIADANASGDATKGKDVFFAAQSACIGCHKVGDEGGITGPDLTAIGRGMTPELITESVLWPKRQIKEGFFLTTVTTHDGKVLAGYKQSEDTKSLVLRAPGVNSTDTISRGNIKDRSDTGTLMPENLTGWMTPGQRRDLLRYLFELGK